VRLRDQGHPLVAIQRMMAQRGFSMSHQTVDNLVKRPRQVGGGMEGSRCVN
jgi:hypothetical protein